MIYELLQKNLSLVVSTIFRTLPLNISSSSWQVSTHSTPDLPADGQHVQRAAITEGVAAVVRSDLASFRLSFVQDCLLRPLGGVAVCHIKMIQQPQVTGRLKPLKSVITERLYRPDVFCRKNIYMFRKVTTNISDYFPNQISRIGLCNEHAVCFLKI